MVSGGSHINSKILMERSVTPLWSILAKWSPTASVCLLCLVLKDMADESLRYHVLCLFFVCILFGAGFASDAVNKIGTFVIGTF